MKNQDLGLWILDSIENFVVLYKSCIDHKEKSYDSSDGHTYDEAEKKLVESKNGSISIF